MSIRSALFAAAWVSICLPVSARFRMPPQEDVPLARIEENVRKYLSSHPDDGQAHYVLGRLYAIAYAAHADSLRGVDAGSENELPNGSMEDTLRKTFLPPPSQEAHEEAKEHFEDSASKLTAEEEGLVRDLLTKLDSEDYATREKAQADLSAMGARIIPALKETLAGGSLSSEQKGRVATLVETLERARIGVWALKHAIAEYELAVEKSKDPALASLGLGWCWEEAGKPDKAIEAYRKAYASAAQPEMDKKEWEHYHGAWHGSVGLEAGTRLLALLPNDDAQREEIGKTVEVLKAKVATASQWITPVVVPLSGERDLRELLDPARIVPFDLVGDGRTRWWPWVKPRTGLLVWDPRGRASLRRGQQLFGSITWYIPWSHGYEPLAWLDDDGDGRLEGSELRGLAIWRDADQDGVSSPEEVMPLTSCGVRSLGFDASFSDDGPWCARGVEFTDGRVAPTYDWLPRSVPRQ